MLSPSGEYHARWVVLRSTPSHPCLRASLRIFFNSLGIRIDDLHDPVTGEGVPVVRLRLQKPVPDDVPGELDVTVSRPHRLLLVLRDGDVLSVTTDELHRQYEGVVQIVKLVVGEEGALAFQLNVYLDAHVFLIPRDSPS